MATPQQLVDGYQSATSQIRARVLAYAMAVWGASASFRDEDVALIISRILPVIQSGQMQVAQLTDAYIGRMAALSGVAWTAGVDRAAILGYRGVPAVEVYKRPAVMVYTALSKGQLFADAVELGRSRLETLVTTDMQQAKNRQATASIARSGYPRFRRVLTGDENCALCAIASTNIYSRGDLMPIHPDCDCGVEPITRRSPLAVPSTVLRRAQNLIAPRIDGDVADDLGAYAGLVTVNFHGELGPTLGWAGDHFTGPGQIAA